MATLTISLTGSAIIANASKSYTVSDTDLQSLLDMAAANYAAAGATNPQILLAWVQNWIDITKTQIRGFKTVSTSPPLITMS
jgi:hypothetical protein